MDNALRTESINRTVAVVIRHALDLDHAVDVLMAEFGFDQVFLALSSITDNPDASTAMWTALCSATFAEEI